MRRRCAATKAHQTRKPLVHARSLGSSCHQRGQSAKITRALQNKQLRLWTPLWPQGRTLGPARPAIERRKQLQPHTARGHKMQNSNMAAPAFRRVLRKRAYPKSQTKRGNHSCKRALFGEGSPSSSLCRRNSLYTQLPSSKYETQPLSRIGNARSTLLSQWLELATPQACPHGHRAGISLHCHRVPTAIFPHAAATPHLAHTPSQTCRLRRTRDHGARIASVDGRHTRQVERSMVQAPAALKSVLPTKT